MKGNRRNGFDTGTPTNPQALVDLEAGEALLPDPGRSDRAPVGAGERHRHRRARPCCRPRHRRSARRREISTYSREAPFQAVRAVRGRGRASAPSSSERRPLNASAANSVRVSASRVMDATTTAVLPTADQWRGAFWSRLIADATAALASPCRPQTISCRDGAHLLGGGLPGLMDPIRRCRTGG